MDMNKKGQAHFVSLALAIVVFIMALALAGPLKSFTDSARGPTNETQVGLDCDNESISDFDKANCAATDFMLPYFIGFLIVLGGAILVAKLYIQ